MTLNEVATALRCSVTAVGILQAKKLLPDCPNQSDVSRFVRSSSLLGQLEKARRESKVIEAEQAAERERVSHRKANLARELEIARADGDSIRTSNLLQELNYLNGADN